MKNHLKYQNSKEEKFIALFLLVFTGETTWLKRYELDERLGEVSERNMEDIENGLTNFSIHGKQEEAIVIERKNRINV